MNMVGLGGDRLACPQAVGVVGIRPGRAALGQRRQLRAVLPCVGPDEPPLFSSISESDAVLCIPDTEEETYLVHNSKTIQEQQLP